jgi:hypothetical protein
VTISGGVIYNQLFKEMFDGTNIPLQNHILSFEIDGNFGVVLTTENDFVGRCQFFRKPSGTICVPTIVGSYLYDYSTWIFGPKVGTYAIIPLAE